jgi:Leucine-rich repeat (LRR) protein
MKNEKENNQIDNLEIYEKSNAELKTIVNIKELNEKKDKYQKIILSHNKLTEIKEIFIFTNLVYLDLSFNYIEKLKNFSTLKDLEILILSNNLIKNISTHLFPLKKLQHLDLSNNKIDMKNNIIVNALKENTELKSLLLFGNENYDFEKTKYLCLENLIKINFLDTIKLISSKKMKKNNKSFVSVKGIKGNKKKVSTLNEYIKFKFDDIKNNEKDYEDNLKNNLQKYNDELNDLKKENKSSYYYFKYSTSC